MGILFTKDFDLDSAQQKETTKETNEKDERENKSKLKLRCYAEEWFKQRLSIKEIIKQRSLLLFSRFKQISVKQRLIDSLQETALAQDAVDAEIYLLKKPKTQLRFDLNVAMLGHTAPLKKILLLSNAKVAKQVEKVISDTDLKASEALVTLYRQNFEFSYLVKLFSAGLLGLKPQRKLVPTRWSITAIDSILSENLIEEIKDYPKLDTYFIAEYEYIGNHYLILIMPGPWSFEVIEAKMPGSVWNKTRQVWYAQDYELYFGRNSYASSCAGSYYAARLAVTEWLAAIKKQASVLVLRLCKASYWAPCGVGVLRETCRESFKHLKQLDSKEKLLSEVEKKFGNTGLEMLKKSKLLEFNSKQKQLSYWFA